MTRWTSGPGRYIASCASLDELVAVDDEHNAATLLDFVSDGDSPDPEVILETRELTCAAYAVDSCPEGESCDRLLLRR